jgi:hypothetical protein
MPKTLRCTLVVLFFACASQGSRGKPQTPPVIGQIVQASGTTNDGVAALGGGTVLAGDTLATAQGGAALVRTPGGGQVEVSENTIVGFSGSPGQVVAKIAQGTIVVQGPNPEFLVVETAQCRIRPAEQASATLAVSVSSGGNATITARTGSISVTGIASGQARTLAQGETFVCPNAPAPPAQGREESAPAPGEQAGQAPPSQAPAPKHSNTALLLLLLGGGAAAGIGAAVAAGGHGGSSGGPASPSAP